MDNTVSEIQWPDHIKARPDMCYESIAPLYCETSSDGIGDVMSFAVSSTNDELDLAYLRGCIHKVDILTTPRLADAKIKVTHEVIPRLGACSQIIHVNDVLRVACFDQGCIIPISNFGPKKTFNSDVRGRLQHHTSPVVRIASNTNGNQIASGSTSGEIVLYEVGNSSISYISRVNVGSSFITGISFLKPHRDICLRPDDQDVYDGENLLIYSLQNGHIGLLDTRSDLGQQIDYGKLLTTEPRLSLTSLCYIDSLPGQVVFFGTAQGQLIAIDLRFSNRYLYNQDLPEDGCIRHMKKVTLKTDDDKSEHLLAYTNGTNEVKIFDPTSLKPDQHWISDRPSAGIVKDFCQMDKRIITCGSESSIGCYTWQKDFQPICQ